MERHVFPFVFSVSPFIFVFDFMLVGWRDVKMYLERDGGTTEGWSYGEEGHGARRKGMGFVGVEAGRGRAGHGVASAIVEICEEGEVGGGWGQAGRRARSPGRR